MPTGIETVQYVYDALGNRIREAWTDTRDAIDYAGICYRRTKTWKESNDPLVHEKYCRIKALYEHCPEGAAVICVDEFGPLELRPRKGQGWHCKKHPQRLPATYHRPNGVRHFLAYYDVHADYLDGWFYRRKRREEFLDFLQRVRGRYWWDVKLYTVLDNFSPHRC